MFYSQIILAKKGPLGKVWQAAHWGDKKLGRPAIFATDISYSVDCIQHPTVPMALRVSGHLLLGVVRIYSRQVKFLLDDCQQAVVRVKLAYSTTSSTDKKGGGGGNNAGIDLTTKSGSGSNTHVTNFGEYTAVDFSNVHTLHQFEIPFDLLNDDENANANDWVPAELDDSAIHLEILHPGQADGTAGGGTRTLESSTTLGLTTATGGIAGTKDGGDRGGEEWGVFDPMDDDDEEGEGKKKEDDSTVSDIEKTRAANNESMRSDNGPRTSVLGKDDHPHDLSESGGPPPPQDDDDDFPAGDGGGVLLDDDDEYQMPSDDDASKSRASLKLNVSNQTGDSNNAQGISFGELSTDEEASVDNKKKRKQADMTKKPKKNKRRKIFVDKTEEDMELSNDHIRNMLEDTSDTLLSEKDVMHPATWAYGRTNVFANTDERLLLHHLSTKELVCRPGLADTGHLAPELIALWKRNCNPVRGEPVWFPLRGQDDDDDDSQPSDVEQARKQGAEQEDDDEELSNQEAKAADKNEGEDDDDFPQPDQEDDFPDGGGDIPFDDEDEPPMPADDDAFPAAADSPAGQSQKSLESIFSLGATNGLDDYELMDTSAATADGDADETATSTSKWHKNTVKVYDVLETNLQDKDSVSFQNLSRGVTRRTAAGLFFELLQLKTLDFVELEQNENFGDIVVSAGVKFEQGPPTAST